MKKLFTFIIMMIMILVFASCAEKGTDSEEIQKKGKLVVGVTEYQPMNYKVDGEWTGFDTEFARMFAKEKLNVEVEFVEIDWKNRNSLLNENKIDCIWNGMTVEKYLQDDVAISKSYLMNSQVLVMNSDIVGNYKNGYEVRSLKFAAEEGSAGNSAIEREGYDNVTLVDTQAQALKLVADGTVDAAIIDSVMADAMVGEGKDYPHLAKGFSYSLESFAVAFREGSDLIKMLNDFMEEIRETELLELANKYGVTLF